MRKAGPWKSVRPLSAVMWKRSCTRDIDLVFVSARRDRPVGIDVLNDVIMSKMNEARREKYILTAEARTKEQLEAKKAAAMTFVKRSATYSAYNGLNPIMLLMRLWIL